METLIAAIIKVFIGNSPQWTVKNLNPAFTQPLHW